jgi:hypothetical protein
MAIFINMFWTTLVIIGDFILFVRHREFHLSQSKSIWVVNGNSNFVAIFVTQVSPRAF